MKIILHYVLTAAAILLLSFVLPGIHVEGVKSALVLALVLGLINTFIRPVIKLLTLPLTLLTLGLFSLVINAALILIASHFVAGFSVDGFLWAFIFGIILSLLHSVIKRLG